eukprot:4702032-Prymnesium_polylepis.1
MPRGGSFGGRRESPRDRARALALPPAVPRQVAGIGSRRGKTLRDSATAETPRACVAREPPLRHALHVCRSAEPVTARRPPGRVCALA